MRTVPLRTLAVTAVLLATAACGGSSDSEEESAGSSSGFEPVTIETKFGTAEITEEPTRVVTVGYNEEDYALALGVVPLGAREFIGYDAPQRPWAQDALGGKTVPTVGGQELDLEKIAGLDPDLILGINSYMDQATYDLLAKIAPTVAQTDDYADGATPWQEQTLLTGQALGKDEEAKDVVADVEAQFADVIERNPDFAGKTASFGLGVGATGSYEIAQDDYRSGWLTDLGFEVPKTGGEISLESLDELEADVVVFEGVEGDVLSSPVARSMPAITENRYIDFGPFDADFAAALGFNSPLSLQTVLEIAEPRLAAATDGDPETVPEPYTG
ncbi:MAG: iron-siderophore ABC transporter substrate-binding protein [Nocardioidaceae bacterium]|nr:iron-siderophore ABC transporter substrate-binding protein [Nocardioidaceae bacterium]